MLRHLDATPCPGGGQASSSYNPRDSDLVLNEGDTTDIDFTTAFRASLRGTAPRRRQIAVRARRRGPGVDFSIHEDDEVVKICKEERNTRAIPTIGLSGSSILAQPAQRFRPKANQTSRVSVAGEPRGAIPSVSASHSPRPVAKGVERTDPVDGPAGQPMPVDKTSKIRKPARRGTVYIPSDDTTMPTVYMGMFSPIKGVQSEHNFRGQDSIADVTGIAAQMAKKKAPRMSLVTAPAKRAPLQQSARASMGANTMAIIAGRRTGKENLPPGHSEVSDDNMKTAKDFELFDLCETKASSRTVTSATLYKRPSRSSVPQQAYFDLSGPAVEDRPRRSIQRPIVTSKAVTEEGIDATPAMAIVRPPITKVQDSSLTIGKDQMSSSLKGSSENAPVKLIIPTVPPVQIQQQYPLLSEDISNPAMYEDNWLAHQEIAITQLINSLFASAQGSDSHIDSRLLRYEILEMSQDPSFVLLHKRLQASVLYGNLSISKDTLAKTSRLKDDLGMKQAFLSLWLDTYDVTMLKVGLEVVVGRECSSIPRNSRSGRLSDGVPTIKPVKAAVRKYIEMFLIRNEDAVPEAGIMNHAAWCCQRTLLRSLLLIKLLDLAKSTPNGPFSGCLFQSTSPSKASATVVQAVANMLNPAVGDILRQLGHLGYTLNHVQYPLEEFQYHIENLAVDLRDGVRLTRLVELLLYPSASRNLSHEKDADSSTTINIPSGEVLCLGLGETEWPLSQHLKFPSFGRATRIFNVNIALSALRGIRGVGALVEDVRAENIVDGFREKTVALLWALAGKWGLGGLIDWNDVQQEIKRLRKTVGVAGSDEEEFEEHELENGFEKHKRFLKAWSSAVAGVKGIHVSNLTTSFSDGKIFEAIVDEYTTYLPNTHADVRGDSSLGKRLVGIGCSVQFANLFAPSAHPTPGRFFDSDFTIATLAFLCSRLLSASRRTRAAIVIQRAWRRSQQRLDKFRRRVAKNLAVECMTVVQTRERLLWAKESILRHWKMYCGKGKIGASTALERGNRVEEEQDSSVGDVWLSL